MTSRLRMTVPTAWPGVPLPEVPVRWLPTEVDTNGVLLEPDWSQYMDVPLRPDLTIRDLQSLDVRDGDAVLAFANEHGPCWRPWVPFVGPASEGPPTVDDLRRWLGEMKCAAAHWLRYREGEPVASAWDLDEALAVDGEGPAWDLFARVLNRGLGVYSARLELGPTGVPRPDLLNAMALQLYNSFVEDAPVHRCARCGLPFTRHTGRDAQGQNRKTGVKFCSSACSAAQASADYRRRRRAAKEGPK